MPDRQVDTRPVSGPTERRFEVKFAWYDLWVGVFIDRKKRIVYVCPLPTLLIVWRLR
jgi:hypothetical protein